MVLCSPVCSTRTRSYVRLILFIFFFCIRGRAIRKIKMSKVCLARYPEVCHCELGVVYSPILCFNFPSKEI